MNKRYVVACDEALLSACDWSTREEAKRALAILQSAARPEHRRKMYVRETRPLGPRPRRRCSNPKM